MSARGLTRFAAATAFLMMSAIPSRAEIFRWEDDEGIIHFTDDSTRIPAEYKWKSSVVIHEPPKPLQPAPASPATPGGTPAPQGSAPAESPSTTGGEPEDSSSEAERLKSKIAAKEDFMKYVEDRRNLALNPDRRRVLNPGDQELYNKYKEELPRDRERLRELEPPNE